MKYIKYAADVGHTPGPWNRNIAPASRYPVIFAGRNTHVAQVKSQGLTDAEVEANANLIYMAPQVLAALDWALKRISNSDLGEGEYFAEALDIAAKARGNQS